jgi:hypothetical protein
MSWLPLSEHLHFKEEGDSLLSLLAPTQDMLRAFLQVLKAFAQLLRLSQVLLPLA